MSSATGKASSSFSPTDHRCLPRLPPSVALGIPCSFIGTPAHWPFSRLLVSHHARPPPLQLRAGAFGSPPQHHPRRRSFDQRRPERPQRCYRDSTCRLPRLQSPPRFLKGTCHPMPRCLGRAVYISEGPGAQRGQQGLAKRRGKMEHDAKGEGHGLLGAETGISEASAAFALDYNHEVSSVFWW